jgi:hypothetical protein
MASPPFPAPVHRALTPERLALASVAGVACAGSLPVLWSIGFVRDELRGSRGALGLVTLVTAAISVLLARRALRAPSVLKARLWLGAGGFVGGVLDAILSCPAVTLLRGGSSVGEALVRGFWGGLFVGGPLGVVFGAVYAIAVTSVVRGRLSPSHDAPDRAMFAAGAPLLAVSATGAFWPEILPGTAICAVVGAAGAVAATVAVLRLSARVRFLHRLRAGREPAFEILSGTDHEDEDALIPLLHGSTPVHGVLAAVGSVDAYRGARRAFKLALVPLPKERVEPQAQRLLGAAFSQIGSVVITLSVGVSAATVTLFLLVGCIELVGGFGRH